MEKFCLVTNGVVVDSFSGYADSQGFIRDESGEIGNYFTKFNQAIWCETGQCWYV